MISAEYPFSSRTAGRMRDVTDVQMAGEKNVGTAFDDPRHHLLRTADDVVLVKSFRQIERMMRDDDLELSARRAERAFAVELVDLFLDYASALDRQRTRGVDPETADLVVVETPASDRR